MMHHATLAVAAGSSALMLAAAVVELPRKAPPAPAVLPIPKGDFAGRLNARPDPPFAERWVTLAPAPTAARAEVLPLPVPEEAPRARVHQRAPHELCAAHGMRKEYYRRAGWQYWRCRR
jgi:hypothetical protein